jgi:hypothetical protein
MRTWCHIAAGIAFLALSGCEKSKPQPSTMIDNAVFRDRVIAIAGELFPDVEFKSLHDEPDVVLAGEMRLGLQNIRAKFQLEQHSEDDLRALVEDHFGPVIHKEAPSLDDFSLDELRDRIFPQVMPSEYVDAAPFPLVSFPLASGIRIGLVADFPQTYMYLRKEDLARWSISQDAVYEIALENLEEASRGVDIHLTENGSETFLAIESGDGYDAVRILVPGMQKFFSSHLGETFRFGIPNRDFLICWRIDGSEVFHEKMEAKIIQDNSERPYPLSSSVFVRNSEGNIHEQKKP